MKRTLILSILAVLMAGLMVPQTNAASPVRHHAIRFHGVIAHVGDHGLVMHVGDRIVEIRVNDRTRISLNDIRVHLETLRRGDRAFVRAVIVRHRDRRLIVATHIRAFRRDG